MSNAAMVQWIARVANQPRDGGSCPTSPFHTPQSYCPKELEISPISPLVASHLCKARHYLRSYPGGAILTYGVFVGSKLLGVVVLGVGPANVRRLFRHNG